MKAEALANPMTMIGPKFPVCCTENSAGYLLWQVTLWQRQVEVALAALTLLTCSLSYW